MEIEWLRKVKNQKSKIIDYCPNDVGNFIRCTVAVLRANKIRANVTTQVAGVFNPAEQKQGASKNKQKGKSKSNSRCNFAKQSVQTAPGRPDQDNRNFLYRAKEIIVKISRAKLLRLLIRAQFSDHISAVTFIRNIATGNEGLNSRAPSCVVIE